MIFASAFQVFNNSITGGAIDQFRDAQGVTIRSHVSDNGA
jgi:hypothetical protein